MVFPTLVVAIQGGARREDEQHSKWRLANQQVKEQSVFQSNVDSKREDVMRMNKLGVCADTHTPPIHIHGQRLRARDYTTWPGCMLAIDVPCR
jgi:hypothetical protein